MFAGHFADRASGYVRSDALLLGHPECPESDGVPGWLNQYLPQESQGAANVSLVEIRRSGSLEPATLAWARRDPMWGHGLEAHVRVIPRNGCRSSGEAITSVDLPGEPRALELITPVGAADSILIVATAAERDEVERWQVLSLTGAVLWSGGLRSSWRVPTADRVVVANGGDPEGTLFVARLGTDELRVTLGEGVVSASGATALVVPDAPPATETAPSPTAPTE